MKQTVRAAVPATARAITSVTRHAPSRNRIRAESRKSSAGPRAMNRSCSRTIPISAATAPSATTPPTDQSRLTCSQMTTNAATANAERGGGGSGAIPDDASRRVRGKRNGKKSVERRCIDDRRDVRRRVPVVDDRNTDATGDSYTGVGEHVERRPQNRGSDRRKIQPLAGCGFAVEEGFLEAPAARDAAVVKVSVFVVEGEIAVEPHRAKIREVLDLVRRIETHGDRGKREDKHGNQQRPACGAAARAYVRKVHSRRSGGTM